MTRRATPAAYLCLRVGSRHQVVFLPFPRRTPMLCISTGSALVSLMLPEHLEPVHVEFARQLAAQAAVYAVAVERSWRGLPSLARPPVPCTLTPKAGALPGDGPAQPDTAKPASPRFSARMTGPSKPSRAAVLTTSSPWPRP